MFDGMPTVELVNSVVPRIKQGALDSMTLGGVARPAAGPDACPKLPPPQSIPFVLSQATLDNIRQSADRFQVCRFSVF